MKLQDLLLWAGAGWLLWSLSKQQAPAIIDVPLSEDTTPEEYYEELI